MRKSSKPFPNHNISRHKEALREALTLYDTELGRQIQNKVHELTALSITNDQVQRALLTRPLVILQAERKWIRELMGLLLT